MKIFRVTTAILMICYLLMANVSPAQAMPPLPSSFYGTVLVDGVNPPAGTPVTAWISGVQYAADLDGAQLGGGLMYYALSVPGDDPATPAIEGGAFSQTVTFQVSGLVAAQTGVWQSGTNVGVNLTAVSYITLSNDSVPENSTINSVVGTLSATNPLVGETYTFTLVPGGYDSGNSSFNIVGSALQTSVILDYETQSSYYIRVRITGSLGTNYEQIFVISVTDVNDAPVAVDDTASTTEDTPLSILASTLLSNDTDVDSPSLSLTAVSNPTNGTVNLVSGTITFTPTANFNGTAGFDYTVSDGTLTDIGHVTVTVSAANDAPVAVDDTATTAEDTPVNIPAGTLLANDTDIDGPALSLTAVSNPTNGTVSLVSGTITFTPTANFNGTAGFDYTVSDGTLTDTGHVTITVTAANDTPVAVDDTASTAEDTPLVRTSAQLVSNDTDVDGDPLTVSAVSNPTNGTVSLLSGTITFTPTANFNGTAGFDYTVSDGTLTDTGHVTITVNAVNDAPVAVDDTASTAEDTPLVRTSAQLVSNDTDVDGNPLSVSAVSNPTNGTVSLLSGTITFTPTGNFNGTAGFDYTVSDGQGGTDTGHVTITVNAVNDAPVAVDDTASTAEDTAVDILASALLANDTDVEGNTLTLTAVGTPTNGTVSLLSGTITFTPAANFNGIAGFDYTVSDGQGGTDTGHVTVTVNAVNDAPVAVDDTASTAEDTPLVRTSAQLVANDTDVDGNPLSVSAVSNPTNGTVSLLSGTITFTPAANFNGTAGFDYTVSDGQGGTDTGHVTITVNAVNDAPVAVDDTASTAEDTAVDILASALLANDTDVEGNTLTLTAVGTPINGTVSLLSGTITFTPAANFNGTAGFDYTVSDGQGGTDTGHVTITVNAVNDAPVAVDDTASTAEDTAVDILASALLANDTDVEGNTLTLTAVGTPTNGTVSLLSGTITFTPAANFNGIAGFDYTVSDGQGGTDTGHVTVTVTAVNDAPVAVDDTASTAEDTPLVRTSVQLVSNDTDVDGNPLSVSAVSNPTNGTVSLLSGTITFTPAANFNGTAGFDYTVSDGQGGTDTGHVTITVNAVNDAPVAVDDTASTAEDTAVDILASALLANDTDVEGNTLTLTAVGTPINGTVSLLSGTITFTPAANFNGTAGFDYTVSDGQGGTDTGHVTITVNAVNDAPVAVDDTASTAEDTPLVRTSAQLVSNDTDVDGNPLSVSAVSNPTNGTVSLLSGTITFTPTGNFNGTAGFDYTVSDGQGGTDTGHVTITVNAVNDAPVAVDDTASTAEDTAVDILASALLANDTDVEGNTLTLTAVGTPTNGTVSLLSGTITFTPAANFNGIAGFDYTVSDGQGGTDTGHVTVTVTAVNDAPVAVDDTASTAEDTPLVRTSVQLVSNDTDVDGNPLSVSAVSNPTNGTVSLLSGTITFTPAANFNGTAGFDYTVSDGQGGTDTGHVTITVNAVNDAPVAVDDTASTAEDTAVDILASALLANDTDVEGNTLTLTAVGTPINGTVSLLSGTITFTPAANFNGTAGFDYTVSDGQGGTDTGHVTITVNAVNDAPVAVDDTASTAEDTAVNILASALLANDTDVEGNTLTLTAVGTPTNGTVSLLSGTITFTPAANFNGIAGFDYTVSDGQGGTDTGHVTVTVNAVNDAPVAVDDTASTAEDTPLVRTSAQLVANDTDVDGNPLSVSAVSNPTNGTVSLLSGTITFTPAANFNGTAGFDYTVSDGQGGTDTGHVTITVNAVNDAPVAVDDTASTAEDTAVDILASALLANDTDVDGNPLSVSAVSNPTNGTVSLLSGTITFTPTGNFNGTAGFDYIVSDGQGGTDTGHVTITVNAVNDAPVAVDDTASTAEDTAVDILASALLANDTDVEGNTLTLTAVGTPTNGTVSLLSGTITFTPAANFNGIAGFDYTVSDGQGGTDTGHVTVTVTAVNDAPVITEGAIANVTMSVNGVPNPFALTLHATDVDITDTLTWNISSPASHGTATASGTGTSKDIGYTPNLNYIGTDSFVVRVADGNGGADTITVNVTISLVTHTISGTVGVAGASVAFTGGTPVTSGVGGAYSITVPYNWTGTVTPSLVGYTFSPTSRTYPPVQADQTNQNYTPTQLEYTLTIVSAHGTVTKSPDQPTYHYGDLVQLTANAALGYTFVGWSGSISGTANPITLTITGNMSVTANYTQDEYTLTVISAHGTVTRVPNQVTYHYGDTVQLTAAADPGWTFANWSGGATGVANPVSVTITANTTVTANYTQNEYTLTVISANGTVAKDPDQSTYHYGDVVQLTATPDPGWLLTSWTGGVTGTTNPISVTIQGNTTVTANYTQAQYTLTVISAHGTVTKNPDQPTYLYGDTVQLTAAADPGWTFASWSGGVTGTTNPVSLTIQGDTTVTANYTQNEYTLTVISEHGTVTKDPNQATYHYGDVVQLTATPDLGWNFASWSGDATGSVNPVSVTITGNMSVTANYTQGQYTLTIVSEHGNVVKAPDQAFYTYGDEVVLTATAAPGWTFANWSGAATGTLNPVTITITGDTTVTANYTQDEYTLTVISDHGGVVLNPDLVTYHYGDIVEVTVAPESGWYFLGWSGDATGLANPLSLTIIGDMTITANYGQFLMFMPIITR